MAREVTVAGQTTMLAVSDRYGTAEQIGATLAKSGWFNGITASTGTLIAITMMSENLTPVQFKQRWHVGNNGMMMRVTNSVLGDFKMAGGKYEFVRADREVCEMAFEKDGVKFTSKVTMEEMLATKHPYCKESAYKAPNGRCLKDNWAEHPDDMIFARCCGKGLRRVWPEGMGGIYLKDEVDEDGFAAPKEAVGKTLSADELKERMAKIQGAAQEPASEAPVEVVDQNDVTVCPVPGKNCFGIKWTDMESDRLAKVLKLDKAKFPMMTDAHRAEVERVLFEREQEIQNQAEAEAREHANQEENHE